MFVYNNFINSIHGPSKCIQVINLIINSESEVSLSKDD